MTTNRKYSEWGPSAIGKQGMFLHSGLDVPVVILNHRYVFGRDDLEIQAIGGTLKKWVSAEAVTVKEP